MGKDTQIKQLSIPEVYKLYPTQGACISHLEAVRWNGTPICPYCNSKNSTAAKVGRRHHCNNCNTSFSVTVGTIFHKTKCDLQKWFVAISLILNAKKGLSARQLSRDIDVHKDTAWYMAMRIRRAMVDNGTLLEGICEMDETYVGGKPRKGTTNNPRGRGTKKTPVIGIVERGGRVAHPDGHTLDRMVRESVQPGKVKIFTDEYKGYLNLKTFVEHATINHKYQYVNGEIHTNTIEGFWALLKRGIMGQYHKVSIRHLNKYLAEFCFRYNNRKIETMFNLTLANALGVTL
jgi:transposase-like protein